MSNPKAFIAIATIAFTVAGDKRAINAIVVAVDEQDAIRSAMEAVRQRYPDADIVGGMLEPLTDEETADIIGGIVEQVSAAPDTRGLTAPTVPASRTVH
jgi:hypothetical protein